MAHERTWNAKTSRCSNETLLDIGLSAIRMRFLQAFAGMICFQIIFCGLYGLFVVCDTSMEEGDVFLSSSNMFKHKKPDSFKWVSKYKDGENPPRIRRRRSLPSVANSKRAVDAHNLHRATVGDEGDEPIPSNMLYMTWDPELAINSLIYAKKCIFEHSTDDERKTTHYPGWNGENLWAGKGKYGGTNFDCAQGIEAWFLEYLDYDFDTHYCEPGKLCGHYTQIVWAKSYKVGCAWLNCSSFDTAAGEIWTDTAYMVCHYAPGGNNKGQKLYKVGPRCSECPVNDTCPDGRLCRNPIRDKILPAPSDGGHIFTLLLAALAILLLVGAGGYYAYTHKKDFLATWRKKRKIGHNPENKSPAPPPAPVENPELNGNGTALPGMA